MIRGLPVRRFSAPLPVHGGRSELRVDKHDPQPVAIYIRSSHLAIGPHAPDEVKQALACGEVFVTDRAWHKGLREWMPLSAIVDGLDGKTPPMPVTEDNAHQFYDRVTDSFRSATSELLKSFVDLLSPLKDHDSLMEWDQALLNCLKHAKTFHMRCAELLATTVRYLTPSDAVKRTPIQQLSDEIREEGFAAAHKIAWAWGIETVTGEKKSRERRFHEYLAALNNLPRSLMKCVSAKCYGANVDTEMQDACISSCAAECDKIVKTVLSLMENHPSLRANVAAAKLRQDHKVKLKTRRQVRLAACFVISATVGVVNLAKGDFSVESAAGFTITLTVVFYVILAIVGW